VTIRPPVQVLLDHSAVRRGRDLLLATDAETLELQAAISRIPAPTGSEARRAAFVAERMREHGLAQVHQDDAGNVVGRWGPETGAPILLAAHLDTVFGPEVDLTTRRDGARMTGPGIADNARGLAGLLALARAVAEAGWTTARPILFAATVGEEGEGDLRGAKHLLGNGARDACATIALDGAGLERVVHRALACRRLRFTYRGPGGHSWAAYGVPNPAHAAGSLASGVSEIPRAARPKSACSVVRLQGGSRLNSIPQTALVEVDLRCEDRQVLEAIERELRAIALQALEAENRRRAGGSPPLELATEVISDRPPGTTPEADPLVQAALEATRAVGREPELAAASTDANIPISLGIPAIALGAGGRAG
jgi:acetylornithine deacetylase/succinyl-diaminopimelate desuccinylase-like protein